VLNGDLDYVCDCLWKDAKWVFPYLNPLVIPNSPSIDDGPLQTDVIWLPLLEVDPCLDYVCVDDRLSFLLPWIGLLYDVLLFGHVQFPEIDDALLTDPF
jgi:hypothetical protein